MKRTLLCVILALCCALCLFGCGETPEKTPAGGTTTEEPAETPEPEIVAGREVISSEDMNTFDENNMRFFGRTYLSMKRLVLSNAATGFELCFYGKELIAKMFSSNATMYCRVFVDGDEEGRRMTVTGNHEYTLASDLEEDVHTVRLVKATASQNGNIIVSALRTDGKFLREEKKERLAIEFVGDSVTAGGGTLGAPTDISADKNADASKSYAYRTAAALDADYSVVATDGLCVRGKLTLPIDAFDLYNHRSSTDASPWTFPRTFDIVVVAFGTNDLYCLNQTYTADMFSEDYKELLALIREKNPDAHIVCVYGLMNFAASIENGIKKAVEESNDEKIGYLRLPVGNDGVGQHPSAENAVAQSAALVDHLKTLIG